MSPISRSSLVSITLGLLTVIGASFRSLCQFPCTKNLARRLRPRTAQFFGLVATIAVQSRPSNRHVPTWYRVSVSLKIVVLGHTTTNPGALAASCITAVCIRQRHPALHVSDQINGLHHKASITARGASDHNLYQGVLQTMALPVAHHMSYRS